MTYFLPKNVKKRHVKTEVIRPMKKTYIDERGWLYTVRAGLGHESFKGFYRKPSRRPGQAYQMCWHAVRVLEWRASEREAEADLERWADKKGMKCLKEE